MIATTRGAGVPALYLAFGGLGATASVIPAILPLAGERGDADVQQLLAAVPALFAGLLVGVLAASLLATVLPTERTLAGGAVLQALGLVIIATAPPAPLFIGAALISGIGFGLVEATGTALARAAAGRHTARQLSLLTGTVAIVAAGLPLVVAFGSPDGWPVWALLVAIALHLGAALGFGVTPISTEAQSPSSPATGDRAESARAGRATRRRLGLMSLALVLYVGVETVFAGWSAVIPRQLLAIDAEAAALGTSVFWTLLALGRFLGWAALHASPRPDRLLTACLTLACIALTAAATSISETRAIAIAAICFTVICLGPVYSLILGIALSGLEISTAKRGAGVLVAFGAGGGALIPAVLLFADPDAADAAIYVAAALLLVGSALAVRFGAAGRRNSPRS